MLSMLGWQTAPVPFGKKAQIKAQKQASMPYVPRATLSQSQSQVQASQSGPTYYVFSSTGAYVMDSQRPPQVHGHAGHPSTKPQSGFAQPSTTPRPSSSSSIPQGASNMKNATPSRSFKIYPDTPMLDSFVYERSEDADSDTFTCYSNSSCDTISQLPTAGPSTLPLSTTRRSSMLMITASNEAMTSSSAPSAPDSPHPPPMSLPLPSSNSSSAFAAAAPQGRPLPRSADGPGPRARSGSGDSGSSSNGRRGSASDSERPVVPPMATGRASPPRTSPGGRFPDRPSGSVPPGAGPGPRDVPVTRPRRDSDVRMQVDAPRNRRLSGAVIPTGFGVLPSERTSPPNSRDVVPADLGTTDRHSPPVMRGAPIPSPTDKRDRYSPEREISVNEVFPAPPPGSFYDRERDSSRPTLRRGSQSSGTGSSSSRERQSPQDEPRSAGFAPPTIRSRTLSSSRIGKDEVPRPIVIAGLDSSTAQGASRNVRFSERLICPSPVPADKRRKGWFNKRGDQLWTNDGVFVAPDVGTEYPIELSEYPDVGVGWQNEEGIRIDMQHRLIPKLPLRPALKRGSTSSSSTNSQQQQSRPDARTHFSSISNSIREEA